MDLALKDTAATLIVATTKGEILKIRCSNTTSWVYMRHNYPMTHRLFHGVIIEIY